MKKENSHHTLEQLYYKILDEKNSTSKTSHTVALFQKGTKKIAQKVGEEAVEVVIEAVKNKRHKLINESADLIYHLLVLWAQKDIKPDKVWEELSKRRHLFEVKEKKQHNKGHKTDKE